MRKRHRIQQRSRKIAQDKAIYPCLPKWADRLTERMVKFWFTSRYGSQPGLTGLTNGDLHLDELSLLNDGDHPRKWSPPSARMVATIHAYGGRQKSGCIHKKAPLATTQQTLQYKMRKVSTWSTQSAGADRVNSLSINHIQRTRSAGQPIWETLF